MPSGQSEWDAKHRLAAEAPASEPASIVRELLPLLPSGPALDIACGSGRHTLLLAARGQHVTAVDWSGAALEIVETRARSVGLALRRILSLPGCGTRQTVVDPSDSAVPGMASASDVARSLQLRS